MPIFFASIADGTVRSIIGPYSAAEVEAMEHRGDGGPLREQPPHVSLHRVAARTLEEARTILTESQPTGIPNQRIAG